MPVILPPGVARAPSTTAQNTIQPTADSVTPLVVKGHSATQSANLLEWQNDQGYPCGALFQGSSGGIRLYPAPGSSPGQHIDLVATWDGSNIYVGLNNPTIGTMPAFRGALGGTSFSPNNQRIDLNGNQIYLLAYQCVGATDPCVLLDTNTTITGADYRLFGIRNNGSERWSVDKDGNVRQYSGDYEHWPLTSLQARQATSMTGLWAVSTDATRQGRLVLAAAGFNGSASEGLRIEGDGSAGGTKIGFFGAAAVAQQANASQAAITAVTDANAKSALQAIYNLLKNYNLAPATA